MDERNCWVPDFILFEDYNSNYQQYESDIYDVFKHDFLENTPYFRNLPVKTRKYPMQYGKEEAFFHLTCRDFFKTQDRNPDLRRAERIKWCRAFIENYECNGYDCLECSGIKIWDEPRRNTFQTCILSEEYRYMVVLEKRETYYLLITAYYIENDHSMRKKLHNYQKYHL